MQNNSNKRILEFNKGKEYIKNSLWMFMPYFYDKEIEDLQIHEFGYVTLIKTKGRKERIKDPNITKDNCKTLIILLANINSIKISNKENIKLSVMLPVNKFRFTCSFGSAVSSGVEISIRLNDNYINYSYEDFNIKDLEFNFLTNYIAKEQRSAFFIGATGSGKTTFANLIIQNISTNENIKIVGDIHDFILQKEHKVNELYAKSIEDYTTVFDTLTRVNPERILIPELTTQNSEMILRTIGSGHSGLILTLHADSEELSVAEAFEKNMRMSGQKTPELATINKELNTKIDFFIYLDKNQQGHRYLKNIVINNPELLQIAKDMEIFGLSNKLKQSKKTSYDKKLLHKSNNREAIHTINKIIKRIEKGECVLHIANELNIPQSTLHDTVTYMHNFKKL